MCSCRISTYIGRRVLLGKVLLGPRYIHWPESTLYIGPLGPRNMLHWTKTLNPKLATSIWAHGPLGFGLWVAIGLLLHSGGSDAALGFTFLRTYIKEP